MARTKQATKPEAQRKQTGVVFSSINSDGKPPTSTQVNMEYAPSENRSGNPPPAPAVSPNTKLHILKLLHKRKRGAYHYVYLSQKRQMGTATDKESLEREPAASHKTALVGRKGGWARKHSSMTKFHDLQHATHSPLQLSNTTWCNRSCNTDWVSLISNAWDQMCFEFHILSGCCSIWMHNMEWLGTEPRSEHRNLRFTCTSHMPLWCHFV